jgi:hypothetical protein
MTLMTLMTSLMTSPIRMAPEWPASSYAHDLPNGLADDFPNRLADDLPHGLAHGRPHQVRRPRAQLPSLVIRRRERARRAAAALVRHPSHAPSDCLPHRPPPSCVIRVMLLSLIVSLIARRLPPSSGGSSARPSCSASSPASTRGRHAPPYRALDTTPHRRLWVRGRSIRRVATVNYRP